ncbi:MAG: hypothetical protein BGO11_07535 [Solirubrobacterales bacterium 70-9]|nr:MAG: hypothetical protein BGO11_07535 [Solirubrobacterales bacterium 70-9]
MDRAALPRWFLAGLVVVLLASVVAPAVAGAHGHGTGGKRPHAHKPKPKHAAKPAKPRRLGVEFVLGDGEFDSHLLHVSDTGCTSKTSEEDKFVFNALYMLQLPGGKAAPSLDLVDLDPANWAWTYTVEESGCGSEAEAEGTEHCTSAGGFRVEPPPDGEAIVRGDKLWLDLEVTSGVLIEEADGPERCAAKLGYPLFYPASALFMPRMLSARLSVPLADLAGTPKPRPGEKGVPDLWRKGDIHVDGADRPPLDCSPEAAGDTCDQHVRWDGRVRIFRLR